MTEATLIRCASKVRARRLVLALPIVAVAFLALVGCSRDLDEAGELMDAGMYAQAAALLEQKLMESPEDAQLHLLLGLTGVFLGDIPVANKNLQRAALLDPDLGEEIGRRLVEAAKAASDETGPGPVAILNMAVYYDPALEDEIGTHFLEVGKSLVESGRLQEACEAMRFAITFASDQEDAALDILIDAFVKRGPGLASEDVWEVPDFVRSRDESRAADVAAVLVAFANAALESGNVRKSILWAGGALQRGLLDTSDRALAMRDALLDAANQSVRQRRLFLDAMDLLTTHFSDAAPTPRQRYLSGVHAWVQGDKAAAVEILRQVPDARKERLGVGFVDTVLPAGRVPLLEYHEKQYSPWFGLHLASFTPPRFDDQTFVAIESIEALPDGSIAVTLRVRNAGPRQECFVFFGVDGEERRVRGGRDERFYLIDDFGNRYYAQPPHFVEAPGRRRMNSTNDMLILDPGHEALDVLRFPRMGVGITELSLVSPMHNGHQGEIRFDGIVVRQPQFNSWK